MAITATLTRRLTGLTPTGRLQLGNLVGAIRPTVTAQDRSESVVLLTDLHALTVEHDPARVRALTYENAAIMLAPVSIPGARLSTCSRTWPSTPNCTTCWSARPGTARPAG